MTRAHHFTFTPEELRQNLANREAARALLRRHEANLRKGRLNQQIGTMLPIRPRTRIKLVTPS
jgi:hypothetical protein